MLADIPMTNLSWGSRGKRIEEVGLAVDRILNPHGAFSFMKGNSGIANAPVDWVRDTKRVEFKSCTIKFNRARGMWECTFQGIKANLFDELWLAICNPIGIHIYRVKTPENMNFSKAGAATRYRGHHMFFGGPAHQLKLL